MSPFGTRSAAAELARLLDSAVVPAPGAPGSPAALAGVALRLSSCAPALAGTAVPRADFRAALRTRLVAVASVQASRADAAAPVRAAALEAAVSWSRGVRARRGVGVAVGAMASVVVVAGVGVAGAQSLPGDPFYGVKRTGEAVQLRAADGPLERGTRHLQFASRRLDEVTELTRGRDVVALEGPSAGGVVAGGSSSALVVDTLADMDAETRAARRLLVQASDDGADPAPLTALTTFAARQDDRLSDLVDELPLAAQERAAQSLALVGDVSDEALGLLLDTLPTAPSATVPAPVPTLPGAPGVEPGAPVVPGVPVDPTVPTPTPAPAPSPDEQAAAPAPQDPADPDAPAPQPTATTRPTPQPQPQPSLEVPLPLPSLPVPLPVPLPTSVVVPLPVPLPTLPVPLPLPLPTLPSVPGVPSLPGLNAVVAPASTPSS